MKTVLAVAAVLSFAGSVLSDTITVCSSGCDYTSINAAIDAASNGDVIQLSAEAYAEGSVINTDGKAITISGATDKSGGPTSILDGASAHRVLICQSGEIDTTVFENLLITGGSASHGGGMRCNASSPTLTNCVFTINSAGSFAGGMYNYDNSSPTLNGCTFTSNSAGNEIGGSGGGMFNDSSNPTLYDCMFTNNSSYSGGGMTNSEGSSPTLFNCTFKDNSAFAWAAGIFNLFKGSVTLINCTLTGNSAIQNGGGIFSLNTSSTLTETTVCSNTPDQIDGDWIDNSDNCVQESCDDCDLADCPADFNGDNQVNGQDLGVFLVEWGACTDCAADFNGDGTVDGIDLGLFLVAWGPCP